MPLEQEFLDWFNQTAAYEPPTGTDAYGKPTYGTPVSVACRVEGKIQQVTDKAGNLVRSMQELACATPSTSFDFNGRWTLPGDTSGRTPIAIGGYPDENGNAYLTVVKF